MRLIADAPIVSRPLFYNVITNKEKMMRWKRNERRKKRRHMQEEKHSSWHKWSTPWLNNDYYEKLNWNSEDIMFPRIIVSFFNVSLKLNTRIFFDFYLSSLELKTQLVQNKPKQIR